MAVTSICRHFGVMAVCCQKSSLLGRFRHIRDCGGKGSGPEVAGRRWQVIGGELEVAS